MENDYGYTPAPIKAVMKTERKSILESDLQTKNEDATDSADINTQVYVEKYSVVITPTAWMIAFGEMAIIVVEYIIKTDPGAGTVSVKTLIDGADAVEKTGLTISSGKQTAVHTEIGAAALAAGTSYTISLEAKNSDAAQTSVIDYCNIYLQLGTTNPAITTVALLQEILSLSLTMESVRGKVWSGATDTAVIQFKGSSPLFEIILAGSGSTISLTKQTNPAEMSLGSIGEESTDSILVQANTTNADNPVILQTIAFRRVWLE